MTLFAPRAGLSRATWLSLLFTAPLGPGAPAALPEAALDRTARAPDRGASPETLVAPLDGSERERLSVRAARLETLLDEWRDSGWWVLGGSDEGFPRRLRRRLGADAPALLWVQGEAGPCARGGIALVQGTDRTEAQILVSGATSIRLKNGSITIEPEGGGATALRLSPPGCEPGNEAALAETAWALADAVVVAGLSRGDSAWAGIVSLIDSGRQPVWLANMEGDAELLLRAGARPAPPDGLRASVLLAPKPSREARALMDATSVAGFAEAQAPFGAEPAAGRVKRTAHLRLVSDMGFDRAGRGRDLAGPALFDLFRDRLLVLLRGGPLGAGPIAEAMGLLREQTDLWLLRALQEQAVRFDPETTLYSAA
ncbi:hypothetical protein NFI95_12075 [Acetobacteraceae bacterium KSS8]|uniref:Uncharacterized protein n=1 Tax=Endosaccharibacter trunci TaxID=2812733 RepID=A0ABT1WAP1_9PROT|nr:hypothetical protein [Acetobacteraceae bacterium KSS8]